MRRVMLCGLFLVFSFGMLGCGGESASDESSTSAAPRTAGGGGPPNKDAMMQQMKNKAKGGAMPRPGGR